MGYLVGTTFTREKITRGSSVYSGIRHSSPLLRGKHLCRDVLAKYGIVGTMAKEQIIEVLVHLRQFMIIVKFCLMDLHMVGGGGGVLCALLARVVEGGCHLGDPGDPGEVGPPPPLHLCTVPPAPSPMVLFPPGLLGSSWRVWSK